MRKKLLLLTSIVLTGCSMGAHQGGDYAIHSANSGAFNSGSMYGASGCAAPVIQQAMYNPCAPAPVRPACAPAPSVPSSPCVTPNIRSFMPVPVYNFQQPNYVAPLRPVMPSTHLQYMPQPHFQDYKRMSGLYGTIGAINYDAFHKNSGIQGRLGHYGLGWLGAEVEGSLAVLKNDDKLTYDGTNDGDLFGRDIDTKSQLAGFAVARKEIRRDVNLLARVGYHTTKRRTADYLAGPLPLGHQITPGGTTVNCALIRPCFTATPSDPAMLMPENTYTKTVKGLAFGAGVEADLTPVDAIRADITAYDIGTSYDKSVSLGYLRRF